MPTQPRAQLEARLNALLGQMNDIMALDEKDRMDAFAGIADEILEDASDEDRPFVWERLQGFLRFAGMAPTDAPTPPLPEPLETRMRELQQAVADYYRDRAGKTPSEFEVWFWQRVEKIEAEVPPERMDDFNSRLADVRDDALDSGLFVPPGREDEPFAG